ncbi:uncharacterized protein METZ01_LOCUS291886, partial [marine metagenome]
MDEHKFPFQISFALTIGEVRSMLRMSKSALLLITFVLVSAFQAKADPIFVVGGRIANSDGTPLVNAKIQVKNTTNLSLAAKEVVTDAGGVYKILFIDLFDDGGNDGFVSLGDELQVQVSDASNNVVAVHKQTVTAVEIANKFIEANIQLFAAVEDTGKTINLAPVNLVKQVTSYSIVSPPARGAVSSLDSASGQALYSPKNDVNGSDSFVFEVVYADGSSDQVIAKIAISS